MAPFAGCFTRPTWANLLVLATGALLSLGRRTMVAAPSSMGLRGAATFTNPHRVLNRSRWSGQAAARCLLGLLVAAFVPGEPVVIGVKSRGLPEFDARPFDPPSPRLPGTKGRPRVAGMRQPTLLQRLADPETASQRVTVTGCYGQTERRLDVVSGTALWCHPGKQVLVRWLLVRDLAGEFEPLAFLRTDQAVDPLDVLRFFVRRWSVEVTFAEVRRHLGVETQRQWSDLAIARTTPCLLALFSLVTLRASDLAAHGLVLPRRAAWYEKLTITFSDALAAVRRQFWITQAFLRSP